MHRKKSNKRYVVFINTDNLPKTLLRKLPTAFLKARKHAALYALFFKKAVMGRTKNFDSGYLYHASNVPFLVPDLSRSSFGDCGIGHYTSASQKQSESTANWKKGKKGEGWQLVYRYSFDPADLKSHDCKVKQFLKPGLNFLLYMLNNRQKRIKQPDCDFVKAPTADGNISNFVEVYTPEKLKRLSEFEINQIIQKLTAKTYPFQYVFKTKKALDLLKLEDIKNVETGEIFKKDKEGEFRSFKDRFGLK